jgi:hypothetical protein
MNKFYVYNKQGEVVGIFTKSSFTDFLNQSNHKDKLNAITLSNYTLRSALLGDKGYGYCEGFFISYRKVSIMSISQQKSFTNEFFSMSYERLYNFFKQTKEWCEDTLHDVIAYVYDKMNEVRGVNNLEATIKFKYFNSLIDKGRKVQKRFIFPDPEVIDIDNNKVSYIDQFAVTSATLDEATDSCLNQVNDLKMVEMIKEELYTNFKNKEVDMYLDYIENFRGKRTTDGTGGLKGASKKWNVSVSTLKNKIKQVKEFMSGKLPELLTRFTDESYPSIDNISLKNIIND